MNNTVKKWLLDFPR